MDDLSGLDWSSTSKNQSNKPPPMNPMSNPSYYQTLRPTPSPQTSGRNTPLSAQGSGFGAPKPSKPAQDSFSNLVNFGAPKSSANLSLRERQEQFEVEKRRKEDEKRKQMQAQYGGGQYWDNLGSGSAGASRTASPAVLSPPPQNGSKKDDDDDLFAAFNKNTKVDNASHYPPPVALQSGKSTPANAAPLDLSSPSAWGQPPPSKSNEIGDDDDDPFGLSQMKQKSQPAQQLHNPGDDEDDDLLGDLGRPVEEVRRKTQVAQVKPEPGKPIEDEDEDSDSEPERLPRPQGGDDPFDKAVAELVDMGFTLENARRGLTESGAGLNVQAAVGWLLDDAHRQARQEKSGGSRNSPAAQVRQRDDTGRSRNNASPAWMREGQDNELPARRDNRSPAVGDGDISKQAAALGKGFLKTAGSLWKSGSKQVQRAMADFQQEGGDPNQPKWMRSAQQEAAYGGPQRHTDTTDEALMLNSGGRPERQSSRPTPEPRPQASRSNSSRAQSPALPSRPSSTPKWQQAAQPSLLDPRARLNKQIVEEQSSQAYVSPARRKKATPSPQPQGEIEPDLLFGAGAPSKPQHRPQPSPSMSKPSSQVPSRTITPRPAAPARNIPSLSAGALQTSNKHRLEGTAHFKRGDYDAAHTAYSASLSGVPSNHPVAIVLLTNRALTALKTGSPKQAVDDSEAAILLIGPSRGEGEKVSLGPGEERDMKDLYGKALARKAEALEQMEKWADAASVWQLCVEAGVGGATAIAGRQRCQKALAPKPKPAARPTPISKPRPKPSATTSLAQKDSEAVQRLREANKAAEKADDEKFALSEKIDAKVAAWRDGKRDNLRALLGSLDTVLWENSGWKKIGLHELVMANKVKIHYMKAIAKTHPDKLPQDASTEVNLIAGIVFSTLNEAWDKFKAENGL